MSLQSHVSQKVLKFLLKRTGGDMEIAQEVLQETWVAALKSYATFRHKSSYFTWLCKISLNKLSDYYRDQVNKRSKLVIPTIDKFNQIIDPQISLEEKLSLEELKIKVNQCLNLLPMEYRQLLQLRYYEKLTSWQIRIKLNLPSRSLEGKLYRAKRLLAKVYAQSESSSSSLKPGPSLKSTD